MLLFIVGTSGGKEVRQLDIILAFVVSLVAGILANYISDLIDRK